MQIRPDSSFGRVSYYIEASDGRVWAAPSNNPKPWKYLQKKKSDI